MPAVPPLTFYYGAVALWACCTIEVKDQAMQRNQISIESAFLSKHPDFKHKLPHHAVNFSFSSDAPRLQ